MKDQLLESAHARYDAAMQDMQRAAAALAERVPAIVTPHSLRGGVAAANSATTAIARLLIDRGVITEAEYIEALADDLEQEAQRFVRMLETVNAQQARAPQFPSK